VRRPARASGLVLAIVLAGCGGPSGDPLADRGKQVYLSQCISCHAVDPGQSGAVGPAVRGASRELLDAKVLRGAYPPGYRPKRPTQVMQPQPQLASDIPALAEYLK
jgi:mono/diheme cytochrome c family protein